MFALGRAGQWGTPHLKAAGRVQQRPRWAESGRGLMDVGTILLQTFILQCEAGRHEMAADSNLTLTVFI